MTKDQQLTFTAQCYGNAETVGNVGGTTVFVPQLIVGEKALVQVNYTKGNVAYADVVKVLQPSPKRQTPPCPHFGECGGCALMYMDYSEQLAFKQNKVQQNLKKLGGLSVEVLPCVPSPQILGYRNKLSLPVRGQKGNVQLGMYRRGSHDVVDTDNCLLGGGWSTTLCKIFRDYLNQNGIEPYNEKDFSGTVRHLVARWVDGQLLATVVCNGTIPNLQPFAQKLQQAFPCFGLFANINTYKNNVILGKKTIHICGQKQISSTHLGVRFHLRPDSFFQVNDGIKNGIYQKVKELLQVADTQVLVDCFSGIGILTNVLASPRYQTYAVEIDQSAVADANESAKLNATPNLTNICGDVNQELPKICADSRGKVLSLVVDPPRKGLGQGVCQTVCDACFDNVVYVSCDSATLARDLCQLSTCYDVAYVQPWDMFPQTAEVETVVHLIRKKSQGEV